MLTKITIRNFKCFKEVVVDLASPVVFIGPNNSGKTSALQALALWEEGIKKWIEKREIDNDVKNKKKRNRFRKITVKLKNKRGYKVRTMKGYYY